MSILDDSYLQLESEYKATALAITKTVIEKRKRYNEKLAVLEECIRDAGALKPEDFVKKWKENQGI